MSVEFPLYMYVDQYYSAYLINKLTTAVCSTLMSLLPAEFAEAYTASCRYAAELDEENVFETSFAGGVADVRSCPEDSFTSSTLQDCTPDPPDAFVNPSNPDGGPFPLPYARIDVSILTASEPDAEALIAVLAAPTADNWALGRALDKQLFENLIPSEGGRTRVAASPTPLARCPEVDFSHSANSCCYSAPILFSSSGEETWQAACGIQPTAVAAWQIPPSSPPTPLPAPLPLPSPPPPPPSPPTLPSPAPSCAVCALTNKGCNCCYLGGSWEGQCGESGPYSYELGASLCDGACESMAAVPVVTDPASAGLAAGPRTVNGIVTTLLSRRQKTPIQE